MLTGIQIRAARGALRLSIEQLAAMTGVSARTIKRMEVEDGIPPSNRPNIEAILTALAGAGIEFIGTPEDGPGIRLRRPAASL